MTKMKVEDFIKKAEAIQKLPTKYQLGKFMNSKSGNVYLCDCSGLIKAILWGYPENGKYTSNGIPDINANTMISRCSNVTTDFRKLQPGWLVWMNEHIGIYIGNGIVIEATAAWENKVLRSYCVGCGISNKENLHQRKWIKCGQFDKYIDYSNQVLANSNKVNIYYRVATQKHGWLPEVKNLEDYAGYQGSPIVAVAMKVDQGKIRYRVHLKGQTWLGWVTGYNTSDIKNGYAGNHQIIDAIQIYYETPDNIRPYQRVKYKTNYDWQYDMETSCHQDGYAGLFNHPMTKLMIIIE